MYIVFRDLQPKKGIPYCRVHIDRLVKEGKFPQPVPLSSHRKAWIEAEVDEWCAARVRERDERLAKKAQEAADAPRAA
jgi:hypothetical protein